MKRSKITENPSQGQVKDKANNWKNKAISRGQENVRLRKQLKEVRASRDEWRNKYKTLKSTTVRPPVDGALSGEKAAGHQYSLAVVRLILELHQYGTMSLRGCRHSLMCMFLALGLSGRQPSHSTIRNWLCKGGHYRVHTAESEEEAYVVYVDESIVLGSEKILLILGVPAPKIPTTRALTHSDMAVLYVGANTEWKAEHIAAELAKIAEKKTILYAVSDEGNNLCAAYKSLQYTHIADCTHRLANYLKRLYEKDTNFDLFRQLVGHLRKQWNLSKAYSAYMPPTMRGKMRFANIFPCIAWAQRCLSEWAELPEKVQESLVFLKENAAFIVGLGQVSVVFKTVCAVLKNEGFGTVQKATILAELATIRSVTTDEKVPLFIKDCQAYLEELTAKSVLLNRDHLLVSSDIIESFFGKFKMKINANNPTGLTEFLFTIANFSQSFSIEETQKALEAVKLKDLKLSKTHAKAA